MAKVTGRKLPVKSSWLFVLFFSANTNGYCKRLAQNVRYDGKIRQRCRRHPSRHFLDNLHIVNRFEIVDIRNRGANYDLQNNSLTENTEKGTKFREIKMFIPTIINDVHFVEFRTTINSAGTGTLKMDFTRRFALRPYFIKTRMTIVTNAMIIVGRWAVSTTWKNR